MFKRQLSSCIGEKLIMTGIVKELCEFIIGEYLYDTSYLLKNGE